MRAVFLSPGAGRMYCGNCFRDNTLVRAFRALGHDALMVPLYLPLTLDEVDESAGTPIFYGGINVYLDQKAGWFGSAPGWLRKWLSSPRLLAWAAGKAAKTRASEVGDLALSMLRGAEGRQRRDLEELLVWLKEHAQPDTVFLSNALLLGMAPTLKSALGAKIICLLAGEDAFLDALPEPHRTASWQAAARQAAAVDVFLAPSQYFADLMTRRLGLRAGSVRVVPAGINLEGYPPATPNPPPKDSPPVLGFLARMCREKGLDLLVEAFLLLRRNGRVKNLKLRVGGSCGPSDEPLVQSLRNQLAAAGLAGEVEFRPNLSRAEKVTFLNTLTVFCVPATYGEAFGLYLLEAMAAGVPVVQPPLGGFPEVLAATGGGVLSAGASARELAEAIEALLLAPERARSLGEQGRRAVFAEFSGGRMAEKTLAAINACAPARM